MGEVEELETKIEYLKKKLQEKNEQIHSLNRLLLSKRSEIKRLEARIK